MQEGTQTSSLPAQSFGPRGAGAKAERRSRLPRARRGAPGRPVATAPRPAQHT